MATSESRSREEPEPAARPATRRMLVGFSALTIVVAYGVAGYMALGWSFSDAIYQVVTTVTAVGLGEVHPMTTVALRVHTMLIIVLGVTSVGYTLGGFIQLVTEGELQRALGHTRMLRQIEALQGHTIVAGFGRVGSLVCAELQAKGMPLVVIELSEDRLPEIERLGYLHVHGDATEEEILRQGGLPVARALVSAMPTDAQNVFIALTARQMAPRVIIISRAEQPSTQRKLTQAGADHVVLPAAIGAIRIATLLTNPTAIQFMEMVAGTPALAFLMEEVAISANGPLAGKTLRDADVGRRTGAMVVAFKRLDGRVQFPPPGDEVLVAGDSILILGRRTNIEQFLQHFSG